ncbi:MAG: ribose ABC transporter permease, partial [Eubacteriales bacterium]|nr:ribose ABC transporter permease [Eubacteriales bacterium]
IAAFVICGVTAALGGLMSSARLYSGQPKMGEGGELDAIAAVVLGGTMMTGGAGRLGGTLIGALIIGIINNGLNLLGINAYWQYIAKGVIILIAVAADVIKKYRKG